MKTDIFMSKAFNPRGPLPNQSLRHLQLARIEQHRLSESNFHLRPAGAKTIHRSQGSTEKKIVVDLKQIAQYLIFTF